LSNSIGFEKYDREIATISTKSSGDQEEGGFATARLETAGYQAFSSSGYNMDSIKQIKLHFISLITVYC
jgi:hypothetical protein